MPRPPSHSRPGKRRFARRSPVDAPDLRPAPAAVRQPHGNGGTEPETVQREAPRRHPCAPVGTGGAARSRREPGTGVRPSPRLPRAADAGGPPAGLRRAVRHPPIPREFRQARIRARDCPSLALHARPPADPRFGFRTERSPWRWPTRSMRTPGRRSRGPRESGSRCWRGRRKESARRSRFRSGTRPPPWSGSSRRSRTTRPSRRRATSGWSG